MERVAIYARISSDDGNALGVARQVEDCRKLAAELGWQVAEEYIDNDVSAYSGKRRPAYERMMADIADGYRDAVIVYHQDRLHRRPIELEQFLEVVNRACVRAVRFVSGPSVDVAEGDGLVVLRIVSAMAAGESATKSRRVSRKMDEVAAAGKPHGGPRPFGYEADMVTVRPDEAEVIRTVVARFIAGESLRSLATWLDEQEVPTARGGSWSTTTLRSMISQARIAGLREHRGEVVADAVWPAIITAVERDKVLALLASRATSNRRSPRRYLLSGLLRCSKCGHTLYSAARQNTRRYVCSSGPDHGGCGKLTIVAPPVEDLITAAVLYRLDTPELDAALRGQAAADSQAEALSQALAADRAQLDELATVYADKAITTREWMAARRSIEARIDETEHRLARLSRSDALAGWVGNGAELRKAWESLNLTRQTAIVKAVLDHAVILPGDRAAREVDLNRVQPVWRL